MPITTVSSDYNTVTAASQKLAVMIGGYQYKLVGSVGLYYAVGPNASVTASAADNNHYLPPGMVAYVAKKDTNDTVAVIRETTDGVCTLSRIEPGSLT